MSDDLANSLREWAKSGLTRDLYQGATPLCDTLERAADRIEVLEAELAKARTLAEAVHGLGLRELVAGWNGEGREKPYDPHPAHLWANVKTTCGTVYAIDSALRAMKGPTP